MYPVDQVKEGNDYQEFFFYLKALNEKYCQINDEKNEIQDFELSSIYLQDVEMNFEDKMKYYAKQFAPNIFKFYNSDLNKFVETVNREVASNLLNNVKSRHESMAHEKEMIKLEYKAKGYKDLVQDVNFVCKCSKDVEFAKRAFKENFKYLEEMFDENMRRAFNVKFLNLSEMRDKYLPTLIDLELDFYSSIFGKVSAKKDLNFQLSLEIDSEKPEILK